MPPTIAFVRRPGSAAEVRCTCGAPTTSFSARRSFLSARQRVRRGRRRTGRRHRHGTGPGSSERRMAASPPCRGRVVRQDPRQAPHVSGRGLSSGCRRGAALRVEHLHDEQKRLWPRKPRGRDRRLSAPRRDGVRVQRRDLEQYGTAMSSQATDPKTNTAPTRNLYNSADHAAMKRSTR